MKIQIGKTYLDTFGKPQTILGHAVDHKPSFPLFYSHGCHYNDDGKAVRGGHHLIVGKSKKDEAEQIKQILINILQNNHLDHIALIKDGCKNLNERLLELLE